MGNYSKLYIDNKEIASFKYDIPFIALMAFTPEEYYKGVFRTSVKLAKEHYGRFGITLDKLEEKLAEISELHKNVWKRYRSISVWDDDAFYESDDDDENYDDRDSYHGKTDLGAFLHVIQEDGSRGVELLDIYEILKNLERFKNSSKVRFDIKEIIRMDDEQEQYRDISKLFENAKNDYLTNIPEVNILEDFKQHDFFICHDSRDKKRFVEPLAKALKRKKIKVWYDKFVLKAGDSLTEKINEGLQQSKYGIVVISKNFIDNSSWPRDEFISLRTKERVTGKRMIVPIWRKDVTYNLVSSYNLELADRFALLEKSGLKKIVNDLEVKLKT